MAEERPTHILVVEDELHLATGIKFNLIADPADCHFAFRATRGGSGNTAIGEQPSMPVAVIRSSPDQ